jgi:nucleotide-binding universal stress UspA family protein
MIALKRVLVPTDFSEASEAAVKYGVALARAFNATLSLLHVVVRHELDMSVERRRVVDTLLAEVTAGTAAIGLDESLQRVARELLGNTLSKNDEEELRVEYVLRASGVGGPYVEIVRYAKDFDIDLIVMGTHGRGFVAHMLMGSVAEKVVRRAPCPVLTVRHPEHEFVMPGGEAAG